MLRCVVLHCIALYCIGLSVVSCFYELFSVGLFCLFCAYVLYYCFALDECIVVFSFLKG